MAQFIDVENDDHVVDLMFCRSNSVIERQERRLNELSRSDRPLSRFESAARKMYERFTSGRRHRATLMSTRRLRNAGKADCIFAPMSVEEFQTVSATMEDIIMASPTIRKRYLNKTIEGYANTYRNRDEYAMSYKHSNPVYRKIQNNVAVEEEDGSVASYCYPDYGEEDMAMADATEARQAWARADEILEDNMEDPTSQYNALL